MHFVPMHFVKATERYGNDFGIENCCNFPEVCLYIFIGLKKLKTKL